jgi:hypothetical protein
MNIRSMAWLSVRIYVRANKMKSGRCRRGLRLDIDSFLVDFRVSSGLDFCGDGHGFELLRSHCGVQFSEFDSIFEPC